MCRRRLFDSTCKKLVEWAPLINKCDVLIGGGTVRVWNELYSAKTRAPMERVRALPLLQPSLSLAPAILSERW